MSLISMIMEVYNEEQLLPASLTPMLPYVDQAIIIDGSAHGPSTDGSANIIKRFQAEFPGKIIYIQDTFKRDDGAWDETTQANLGFDQVRCQFVMRTHADIVYDFKDMSKLRDIVKKFSHKTVFYCPMVEFFYDTKHIRLYPDSKYEELFPRPIVGDVPVISMTLKPHFIDAGEYKTFSLQADPFGHQDIIYMPNIKRFHYGWVKPFESQVLKHIRYIKRGDYGEYGTFLQAEGEKAVLDWAVKHVLSYKTDPSMFPYAGDYPIAGKGLQNMTAMDGHKEFIQCTQM